MKVKKTDLLYRWHENFYHPDPAPAPSSLCSMFWIATVGNVFKWLDKGINACQKANVTFISVWLMCLLVGFFGMWAGIAFTINHPVYILATVLPACFALFVAALFTLSKFVEEMDKEPYWVKCFAWIVIGSIIASVMGALGYQMGWEKFIFGFGKFVLFFAVMIGVVVGAILGLPLLYNAVLRPMATWRFIQMCGTALYAIKTRVCPLIEVEDDGNKGGTGKTTDGAKAEGTDSIPATVYSSYRGFVPPPESKP